MSAEKCSICGVSGTSTYRCCGNNKNVRLLQIEKEVKKINDKIDQLKKQKIDLIIEKVTLEDEE